MHARSRALACAVWGGSAAAHAQSQPAASPPAKAPPEQGPATTAKTPSARAKPVKAAPQEITVTAAAQEVRTSIDRKSYSLAKDLQATTGAIGDALRNLPSVQVDVQGNLSLRGDSNVTILVDGQPSPLFSGPNRADALQQLPASQFERVEVITNPSAAFKPDGSAGIINLVTKKGQSGGGLTGSLRASGASNGGYRTSANLSYGNKVYSVSGGLAVSGFPSRSDNRTNGQLTDPVSGEHAITRAGGQGVNASQSVSLYGNGSYTLSPKDRLTGSASRFAADFTSRSSSFYGTDATTGPLAQDYSESIHSTGRFSGAGGSAGYVHKFAGEEHELSVNLNYQAFESRYTSPATITYTTPVEPPLFQAVDQRSADADTDLKVEYKTPAPGQAKLVVGYELDAQHQRLDHPVSLGTSPLDAAPSPALTNLFKFDQTVHALYATYQQAFGAFTALPGVRLEEAIIDTDLVTTGQTGRQTYFTAYPTLHLAYDLKGGAQLKASYSRRVNRPGGGELNPFRLYNGPLSYTQGNPDLRPQTTDSYELGYEIRAKSGSLYSATLFYRDNRKSFTTVTQDLGAGVLLTTQENLGTSTNTGLELVTNGKLLKTLSYNVSADAYWDQIDAANLGFANRRSGVAESGRANLNWEASPKDLLQVNVIVSARRLTPQGYRDGFNTVNLGYRHTLDARWSIVGTVQDLFDAARFRNVIDTPTLQQDSRSAFHRRAISIGFVYALGSSAAKRPDSFDYGGGGGPGGGTP